MSIIPTATKTQVRKNTEFADGMSDLRLGTCVSIDWVNSLALVNVPGGQVSMPMVGTAPIPQRPCWVGFFGKTPICLGPAPRSTMCTVSGSPSGGVVQVTGDDGGIYKVVYDARLTPASGNRVLVDWLESGGTILCVVSADPVTFDPNTPAPPVVVPGKKVTRTFNPTDSGSQSGSGSSGSGSFFTPRVFCSDSNVGGYFYGTQIASTIPDSASIISVELYLDEVTGYGDAPHMGLHNLATKAGSLAVSSSTAFSAGSGWKRFDAFGTALKTGASKGFATGHGGYHVYNNAGINNSGACRITWQTA